MASQKLLPSEFSMDNVCFGEAKPGEATGEDGKRYKFTTYDIFYKYAVMDKNGNQVTDQDGNPLTRKNRLRFELPEIESRRGITVYSSNEDGERGITIYSTLTPVEETPTGEPKDVEEIEESQTEIDAFVKAANEIYDHVRFKMVKKGTVKNFEASSPASLFKHPIIKEVDRDGEATGRLNYTFPVKLGTEWWATKFRGIDGKRIDPDLLRSASVRMIPEITFSQVFIGVRIKIRQDLTSAIITRIAPSESIEHQSDTLEKYRAKNPDVVKHYENTIASLEAQLAEARAKDPLSKAKEPIKKDEKKDTPGDKAPAEEKSPPASPSTSDVKEKPKMPGRKFTQLRSKKPDAEPSAEE